MFIRSQRFSRRVQQQEALTIEAVRQIAPSAFAEDKHDSRSSRYTYIPTARVIEGMIAEGFLPFKACQSSSRIEGKTEFTKHLIRFRHRDAMAVNVGDSVPEVVLINSHDGTSAYKIMAGIFRLVCSNGLVVAEATAGSISVPHKGDIVNRVIEGSFQIIDTSKQALGAVKGWSHLQLTSGEQSAFAEAAHVLRFADADGRINTPIQGSHLLTARREDDKRNDLWSTFNRVQENVIRGGLSEWGRDANNRPRRVTTREVKGIDQDVKLNRALWTLAERMAELKTTTVAA